MSLPRYPEYKDSGVAWLGEVPAHWQLTPLKRLGTIRYGIGEPPPYRETGTALIRATNVHEGKLLPSGLVFVAPDDIPSQRILWLRSGDIIVVRSGAYTGDSALVTEEYGGAIAGFDMVFRGNSRCVPSFIKFVLLSRYVKNFQLDLKRARAAQPHLNAEELGECIISLAPQEEQAAIAAFLDRETAKIDALVAEQEKLLTLLAEKRQATISHAVTKGLNPDAPMKDSGVEWLGKVPGHWEIGNLKRFAEVIDCKHHTVEFLDDGLPIVSIRELRDNRIDLSNAKLTSPKEWDFLREGRIPQHGDLIFCRNASVGAVGYVRDEQVPFCMGQDVCLIRPQTKSRFMHFQATCRTVANQIEAFLVGATIRRANVEEIRNLLVTWPPAVEQEEIAAFLDAETARLDALTAEATRAIALLKERRTALISAAVTGKIDVRHEAAQPIVLPCL